MSFNLGKFLVFFASLICVGESFFRTFHLSSRLRLGKLNRYRPLYVKKLNAKEFWESPESEKWSLPPEVWRKKVEEKEFDQFYNGLVRYEKLFGNLEVKNKYVVPKTEDWPKELWGYQLGLTDSKMKRSSYLIGEDTDRYHKLESLGFDFEVSKHRSGGGDGGVINKQEIKNEVSSIPFSIFYEALRIYHDEHGHVNISLKYIVPCNDVYPVHLYRIPLGKCLSNLNYYLSISRIINETITRRKSYQSSEYQSIDEPSDQTVNDDETSKSEILSHEHNSEYNNILEEGFKIIENRLIDLKKVGIIPTKLDDEFNNYGRNLKPQKQEEEQGDLVEYESDPQDEKSWSLFLSALYKYKEINGHNVIPENFTIPIGSDEWPKELWGRALYQQEQLVREKGRFLKGRPDRVFLLCVYGFFDFPTKYDVAVYQAEAYEKALGIVSGIPEGQARVLPAPFTLEDPLRKFPLLKEKHEVKRVDGEGEGEAEDEDEDDDELKEDLSWTDESYKLTNRIPMSPNEQYIIKMGYEVPPELKWEGVMRTDYFLSDFHLCRERDIKLVADRIREKVRLDEKDEEEFDLLIEALKIWRKAFNTYDNIPVDFVIHEELDPDRPLTVEPTTLQHLTFEYAPAEINVSDYYRDFTDYPILYFHDNGTIISRKRKGWENFKDPTGQFTCQDEDPISAVSGTIPASSSSSPSSESAMETLQTSAFQPLTDDISPSKLVNFRHELKKSLEHRKNTRKLHDQNVDIQNVHVVNDVVVGSTSSSLIKEKKEKEEVSMETIEKNNKIKDFESICNRIDWPESLYNFPLGVFVKGLRIGDILGKQIEERRHRLNQVNFTWGDESKYCPFHFASIIAGYNAFREHGNSFIPPDFVIPSSLRYYHTSLWGFELGKHINLMFACKELLQHEYPKRYNFITNSRQFGWSLPVLVSGKDTGNATLNNIKIKEIQKPFKNKYIDKRDYIQELIDSKLMSKELWYGLKQALKDGWNWKDFYISALWDGRLNICTLEDMELKEQQLGEENCWTEFTAADRAIILDDEDEGVVWSSDTGDSEGEGKI